MKRVAAYCLETAALLPASPSFDEIAGTSGTQEEKSSLSSSLSARVFLPSVQLDVSRIIPAGLRVTSLVARTMAARGNKLRFDGRVAVVTGAGAGLGKAYALLFAERGASVVVNDLGGSRSGEGSSNRAADTVVNEIKAKGGKAVADYNSVENGEKIIETAIRSFGRVDILVNNAGILRDRSFARISDSDWDLIQQVHLKGAFRTTQAAWPHFRKQEYGRIIMTSSAAGVFGNFGQANYSAAKMALIGLANTLAIEGRKYDIHCNVIVPMAASRLTEDIMPPDLLEQLKPELIAPVVCWMCHESCSDSGCVIESAAGWVGRYQWYRGGGVALRGDLLKVPTLEDVQAKWDKATDMEGATPPSSIQEVTGSFLMTLEEMKAGTGKIGTREASASDGLNVSQALTYKPPRSTFSYEPKEAIIYALGLGVSTLEPDYLKFLFEGDEHFSIIPTFGIVPAQHAMMSTNLMLGGWPGLEFDLSTILHGEHYIEFFQPLKPSDTLHSQVSLVDVLDKGSGALAIIDVDTYDEAGRKVMRNQFGVFSVGSGGFGGRRTTSGAIQPEDPPSRNPDKTASYTTSVDQAALYRMSGDFNPLHINPDFALMGGFKRPILHGLCTYGIALRAVLKNYAGNEVEKIKAVKARFAKPVYPGDTLRVDMWENRGRGRVHFRVTAEPINQVVLSGGYIDLNQDRQISETMPGEQSRLRFDGRVAIITGAGAELGRACALLFAEKGASVVVNDSGRSTNGEGISTSSADSIVHEIKAKGGKAVADYNSLENGEKIIETALSSFGHVDILVDSTEILQDNSFDQISDSDWDLTQQAHLKGIFRTTQAAWRHFRNLGFGRIIMTSSVVGLLGNSGQACCSAVKMALIGLANTLAIEGRKYDIHCNVIVPMAASRLTEDIMPPDLLEQLKPELIAPVVCWMCHESCSDSGCVIESAAGWVGRYQWYRGGGVALRGDLLKVPTLEDVQAKWDKATDMEGATPPSSIQEVTGSFLMTLEEMKARTQQVGPSRATTDLSRALSYKPPRCTYSYKPHEVIVYALGIGVSTTEPDFLKFLFEGEKHFSVIPTFGIVPAQHAIVSSNLVFGGWPGLHLDLRRILHGEQFIELFQPLKPSDTLHSQVSLVDVLDKGSGTLVIVNVDTYDKVGHKVMFNQFSLFSVGRGGFGGKHNSCHAIKPEEPPSRSPDKSASFPTSVDQAALYRLSGDFNPLHINPDAAALGGFKRPILHGLCCFGIAVRAVLQNYTGNDVERIRAVKGRFAKPLYPGDTFRVDMWENSGRERVHFRVTSEQSDQVVINGGYVDLKQDAPPNL